MTLEERKTVYLENTHEIFRIKSGMSWYTGEKRSSLEEVYADLWLPTHSALLLQSLREHGGVTLSGDVGEGKSTLLYGARAIMRTKGTPYVFINGHFTNTTSDELIEVVDMTGNEGYTVIYDSADYLVSGHRNVRSFPLKEHLKRNVAIMNALTHFRQRDGKLLLTAHQGNWLRDRVHPELLPAWEELTSHTEERTVEIVLPEPEERSALMQKMGLEASVADYIASLPSDSKFLDYIINKWGDQKYLERIQGSLYGYPAMKLFAQDKYGENVYIIKKIADTLKRGIAEESWDDILEFMFSKIYTLTFFTRLQ